MNKRFHCEFKNCKCNKFINSSSNLCYICQHSIIWHSKKSKPPSDEYLSFLSTRKPARSPEYTYVSPIQIAVFVPEAEAIPIQENVRYCSTVDLLPI